MDASIVKKSKETWIVSSVFALDARSAASEELARGDS